MQYFRKKILSTYYNTKSKLNDFNSYTKKKKKTYHLVIKAEIRFRSKLFFCILYNISLNLNLTYII